ncbi:MAG: hypothetical protein HYV33_03075 [Candidatus Kerfeldbacteria bacterium]|nr:hypothetical protein [Candidatus Kerfeldbacteria bacterium]
MQYGQIIQQAWEHTKRYKAMWLIGMLVLSSSGGGSGCNIPTGPMDSGNDYSSNWSSSVGQWFEQYWWIVVIAGLVILALAVVAIVLHYIAVGGLFIGAQQARQGHRPKFGDMFLAGLQQAHRTFAVEFLLGLITLGLMIGGLLSIVLLACSIIGLVLVPFALLAWLAGCVAVVLIISVVRLYSLQYLVLQRQGVWASIQHGWQLLRQQLAHSAVIYGLDLLVTVAVGIGLLILMLLVILPFGIVGFIAYAAASWIGLTVSISLGVLLLIGLILIVKGIRNAFSYNLWHLTFTELNK